MTDYLTNATDLTSVANAIRTKGGTSASLEFPSGFVAAIENIPSGGGGTTVTVGITSYDAQHQIAYVDSSGIMLFMRWATMCTVSTGISLATS